MEEIEMKKHNDLIQKSEYLLSQDSMKEYTDEEILKLDSMVDELIAKYGWEEVYKTWIDYLHTECKTDQEVVNFARNFFDYASDRYIPDPIHFMAYLYYRVDTQTNPLAFDIFDSLAITILPNAGLINNNEIDSYSAEADPRIQVEIEKIKKKEKS